MPAILTHHLFGCDALWQGALDKDTLLPDERDAFLLGNQGPDPLFFLVAEPRVGASSRVGDLMHDERPSALLAALSLATRRLQGRARMVGRAFVAGFTCHYLLDRSVHPLVVRWQVDLTSQGVEGLGPKDQGRVHQEVERDLDETVLYVRRGTTVARVNPASFALAASPEVLAVCDAIVWQAALDAYGIAIDPHAYSYAVRSWRRVARLLWSPTGFRRACLARIERAVTREPYPQSAALSHRPVAHATSDFDNHEHRRWENPYTGEPSSDGFWELY